MATELRFEWDSRELRVFRNRGVDKAILRAMLKAGNRALRDMRAEARRQIKSRKKIKASRILKGLPMVFPGRKGELQNLVWEMGVSGKMVPVSDYPHRRVKGKGGGVMVEINQGSPKLIAGAFIATLRSGHKGVFLRKGTQRLPIQELYTTRLSDVAQDQDFIPTLDAYTGPRMQTEFMRLLPLELEKNR